MKAIKQRIHFLILVTFLPFLNACQTDTVAYVDVPRYMGLWYQISANPVFFNEDLVGVTAEYALNDDGTVKVVNQGFVGSLDGPVDMIEGVAEVVDTETNATLKVDFPGVPNTPFPNYLIVVLDETNYQYAVVTDPLNTTLFVLSRTAQMEESLYQNIISNLEAQHIDTSKLLLTPQP